jgi:phospholipase D1/2
VCGSANLNDRSQLGNHDSEIAIIIEDPQPVQCTMAGRPWEATRFAASLRRQLFRKHLGLVKSQNIERPDENFEPVGVPNQYDWGSPEDNIVSDPLSETFESLWNYRAKTNAEVSARYSTPFQTTQFATGMTTKNSTSIISMRIHPKMARIQARWRRRDTNGVM